MKTIENQMYFSCDILHVFYAAFSLFGVRLPKPLRVLNDHSIEHEEIVSIQDKTIFYVTVQNNHPATT